MAREYVSCVLCGSESFKLLHGGNLKADDDGSRQSFVCSTNALGRSGPVVRCSTCGLVFLNPRLRMADVLEGYSGVVDRAYLDERPAKVKTFTAELHVMETFAPSKGRILDIGSHVGTFLEVARDLGWHEPVGIEPSQWAAGVAADRGLNVYRGTIRDAGFEPGTFDAATMWDVVEHLPDPLSELREIHRVLRAGAVLGICTMNVDSWSERVLRRRWPWYMESHLYYFSPATLSRLLETAGFRVLKVMPHPHSTRVTSFVDRLRGWLPPAGAAMGAAVRLMGLEEKIVTIDFGDFFTLFARKV